MQTVTHALAAVQNAQLANSLAARGLEPYVSPKKLWDAPVIVAERGVLVEVSPSDRRARRTRQRDLAAMGRKSRRTAVRQKFQRAQAEATYRGLGMIYFGHRKVNYALQMNAVRQVEDIAEARSKATGTPYTTALKETEDKLLELLVAYGDIEEAAA